MFNQPSTFNPHLQPFLDRINTGFSGLIVTIEPIFFFSVAGIPLIILWIIGGGMFCTWRMGWINIRGFKQAIAHSVARTQDSIREGIVSILEPFLDTVIICNLTALVIIITGMYSQPDMKEISGSVLATTSFATVLDWFPYLLAFVMLLFAFASMITWSYYGERCWAYLLGESSVIVFKELFLLCVFLGAIVNLGAIIDFSDIMLLAMAVPNLLGCFLLSGKVAADLQDYWEKLKLSN